MKCYNKLADFYATISSFNDIKEQTPLLPEILAQLGFAYARLDNLDEAVKSYRESLRSGRVSLTAIRGLLKIFINSGAARDLEALVNQYRADILNDIDAVTVLARDRLHRRDLAAAHQLLRLNLKLSIEQGVGYNSLTWPVPEPRLRHDREQLELLENRGKLSVSAARALTILRRHAGQNSDLSGKFAPPGQDGEMLRQALAEYHYCPDPPFSGTALGENDYSAIEESFMRSSPMLVVIDNFLSPAALAALREYCEEATIWKSYFDNGYVGTLFGSGFCPRVLLAIADEMKMMMPRIIGGKPLTQAWAFKYDQRLHGINMHADFASVNVNFWITPDDACTDKTTGGMVIYDVPAPAEWTFEDYNGKSGKMAAFLAAHNAKPQRVPYRENRCVLFDSTLFHTTDEIHFKPGYGNRRVNVTLLYGKSLNAD
jgi:tetratricopeptide (TPR) repeat protein